MTLVWGGVAGITRVSDFVKVGMCPAQGVEWECPWGILRSWWENAEPPWQCGVLVYSWDHISCLSFAVLRDGLSIMLWLWRRKDCWIVVLQWRRRREKHQHCGSHPVAYLPADMCPKSSLCCIKERKTLDISTSIFLYHLFQFCIL